jgi:hypothetical protein
MGEGKGTLREVKVESAFSREILRLHIGSMFLPDINWMAN